MKKTKTKDDMFLKLIFRCWTVDKIVMTMLAVLHHFYHVENFDITREASPRYQNSRHDQSDVEQPTSQ